MEKNYLYCQTHEGRSSKEYAVTVLIENNKEVNGFIHKRHFKSPNTLEVTIIGEENDKAIVIFPRGLKIDQAWVNLENLAA